MKKKTVNKRALTVGILTAVTVSLFATVLVAYGKDQDLKEAREAAVKRVVLYANDSGKANLNSLKAASMDKTVDAVDEVAAALLEDEELNEEEYEENEEYYEEDYESEGYFGDDYTGIMAEEYNLGTGIYGFSSRDAYVLACVVSAEVGDQDYDCQLAVANVVIHRALNLGGGPGSIEEAVYQPYQFEVAYNSMQDFLAYGPQEDAIQASQDALNGADNVPGYEHFCYYTIMDDYLECDGGTMIGSEWFYY